MSIRSLGRDNPEMDRIFCYFMETILCVRRSGVEKLPLPTDGIPEPCRGYLDKAMEIFLSAPPPELAQLLLETERDVAMRQGPLPVETALCLRVIGELSWHIWYDEEPTGYLMRLENLWGQDAILYAHQTFYPACFGGDPAGELVAKTGGEEPHTKE